MNRQLGNEPAAQQYLQQALQVSPNHSKAQAALGQYYQDTGRTAEAITMYQQSLRGNWYQPQVQARVKQLQGYAGPRLARARRKAARGELPPGAAANTAINFPPAPQWGRVASRPVPPNAAMVYQGNVTGQFPGAPVVEPYAPGVAPAQPEYYSANMPAGPFAGADGGMVNGEMELPMTEYPVQQFEMSQPYPVPGQVYSGDRPPYPVESFVSQQQSFPVAPVPDPLDVRPGPSANGQLHPGSVSGPTTSIQGQPFPEAVPPTPIQNADPAHVPRISSAPEETAAF